MTITTFSGVSAVPRRGIGLYEFDLASGAPVRLHDMDLRRLLWVPGSTASLELTFEWARGWEPAELVETPFVIMRFLGTRIRRWDEDDEPLILDPTWSDDPSGQVSSFDWDGASRFDLTTLSFQITLSAESVSIEAVAGL